jgi:hypothetical protein
MEMKNRYGQILLVLALETSSVILRRCIWFLPKPLMSSPKRRKKTGMAAPWTTAPRLPAAMRSRSHLSEKENSSWKETLCSGFFFSSFLTDPSAGTPPLPESTAIASFSCSPTSDRFVTGHCSLFDRALVIWV